MPKIKPTLQISLTLLPSSVCGWRLRALHNEDLKRPPAGHKP